MLKHAILLLLANIVLVCGALHASYNGTRLEDLRDHYDFIVVGGGSAGCRLAEGLSSKESFNVLVIEAGGVPPESSKIPLLATLAYDDPRFDWRFKTIPQQTSMKAAREKIRTMSSGRVLGGGSTINVMAYQRGNREDYDSWEKDFDAKGWAFDDVLKLFKENENISDPLVSDDFYGRSGPLGLTVQRDSHPIKEALYKTFDEELGLEFSDPNDGNHWGYYDAVSSTSRGRRVSSFNAFLEPNLHRKNLHVLLHTQVTKVLIEKGRAVGVAFVHNGESRHVQATKEVILSAGALRSPQLLLLSGIGDRGHLEEYKIPLVKHLPGVGQNLQDHFGFLGIVATIPDEGVPDLKDIDGLHQWLVDQTGPFAYPSGIQMGLMYYETNETKKQPDIEVVPIAARNLVFESDLRLDVLVDFYGPMLGKSTLNMIVLIQHPKSRGEVKLASVDGTAPPHIDPKYFSHPDDIETAVKAGQQLLKVMQSERLRKANVTLHEELFPSCVHLELFSDEYLRCLAVHHSFEVFHPCGTCRIGRSDDPMAVLDERLKVRGVEGLRVADNSVMPTITTGHLNAPAMMIGNKAAKLILEDYATPTAANRQEL